MLFLSELFCVVCYSRARQAAETQALASPDRDDAIEKRHAEVAQLTRDDIVRRTHVDVISDAVVLNFRPHEVLGVVTS